MMTLDVPSQIYSQLSWLSLLISATLHWNLTSLIIFYVHWRREECLDTMAIPLWIELSLDEASSSEEFVSSCLLFSQCECIARGRLSAGENIGGLIMSWNINIVLTREKNKFVFLIILIFMSYSNWNHRRLISSKIEDASTSKLLCVICSFGFWSWSNEFVRKVDWL